MDSKVYKERQKTQRVANSIRKENKGGKVILLYFKTYSKAKAIKTLWHQNEVPQWNKLESPDITLFVVN